MSDSDKPIFADLLAALGLLSRLPIPVSLPLANSRGAKAAWAWPIVGVAVGAIAGLVGVVALAIGLPSSLAAGLAIAAGPIVTGGLHEDGLADTADGLWGGWTRERRLEIMKDSSIGSYGVIALILSLGLRWTALTLLFETNNVMAPLIGVAVASRLPMVFLSWYLPQARAGGLSAKVGRPSSQTTAYATFATLVLMVPTLALATVPVAITLAAVTVMTAAIAKSKIGGQTGDILGAAQQISEIAGLLTLIAVFS